ncbi:hypothetical protein BN14_11898 [Rhizoctonia solani AG-1 IB]|uniref:AC transposase n=1 Tax=Thanatephorus cucumeris (strain AG1-IB / isolate 7/3/14) TaxID=1108050 RepID=M5CEP3_THACB|nr:hypothetical protein BN14_11898 [Rhizoctonia solani AG-1 IB]
MICLERKHTGEYLAQKTAECIWRYGLGNKLCTICMDNASNNNTFARRLPALVPGFSGPQSRVRCAAHVLNLVVKSFTSYFMSPAQRKRKSAAVKAKVTRKQRRIGKNVAEKAPEELDGTAVNGENDLPPNGDAESESESDAPDSVPGDSIDIGKAVHDEYVIKSNMDSALHYARTQLGIEIPEAVHIAAQGIITLASKLAKKVHESPQLKHELNAFLHAGWLLVGTPIMTVCRALSICEYALKWLLRTQPTVLVIASALPNTNALRKPDLLGSAQE